MKYGCIGEHLSHSFSKEIHEALADYEYIIKEIPRESLISFAEERDFLGINVTIPYKEMIMPALDEIDDAARKIGAVNTVVNRGGKLCGYNTDFYGMTMLFRHAGIDPKGKRAAILGSGGTSKTANAVLSALGAKRIIRVSRTKTEDTVTYEELYRDFSDTEIIVNTTPVGMFPSPDATPCDVSVFENLSGVIDAVYNPLSTRLVIEARKRGIPAECGLYMLVAQAVRASEIFLGKEYGEDALDRVYKKILSEKENIVLIGMPASGKSTVGGILQKELSRALYDTDAMITEASGMTPSEIFEKFGEEHFRELESEALTRAAMLNGAIIATGGGAILKPKNVDALKQNGRLYFIDRPLSSLVPTEDRPTASSAEQIKKRYEERYGIYSAVCNRRIDASGDADSVARLIKEDFCK